MSCTCRITGRGEVCDCGGLYTQAEYEQRQREFQARREAAWEVANQRKGNKVARVQIDIAADDLRRRLGLSEEQLPDDPTSQQIADALSGGPPSAPQSARASSKTT